jgi:hypothetical protein
MTKYGTRALLLLLVALVTLSATAAADNGGVAPLGIIPTPTPTPNPLTVSIWTNKTSYVFGEYVTIYYTVSQAAYVYIYDIQPDGVVRLIFPNGYSQANYASAGTHTLPDTWAYRFEVTPPAGTEQLQIFASPVPLALAQGGYSSSNPYPMVGTSPESAGVHIKGIIPTDPQQAQWVTAWTSLQIMSSYGYTPPGGAYIYPTPTPTPSPSPGPGYGGYVPWMQPPYPGIPGGAWYWYNGQWYQGTPCSGWYWHFAPDCSCWHLRLVIRLFGGGC